MKFKFRTAPAPAASSFTLTGAKSQQNLHPQFNETVIRFQSTSKFSLQCSYLNSRLNHG